MASKLEMYSALADRTAHQITNSFSEWTAFLKTAARLYKYPFHEQLMIYAQKPDATACAEYDVWNQRMGRYVRRGSTGIALIDTTGNRPRLKYVFDLNDTGEGENSRYPHIWTYRHQYEDAVSKALENRFDVSGDEGLEVQLERAAAQLVDEYWNANQRDILGILADSFLEEYDDFSVGAGFRNAAVVSTTYMLLYRCGMDPTDYFRHEDFLDVFDFNTPSTLAALGTGISQVSETVLRQIEAAVKAEERKMSLTNEAERTENHGQQPDLHTDRGLQGPESGPGRERDAAPGQVREDAPGVSSEGAPGPLERPHPEGTGYRARTRFAKFFNLPELMNLFKEAADIKTADQLSLPTPEAVYHNEVAQPTEIQKSMVKELSERASAVHARLVDPSKDNMLKITSDGRKLGLDQRVINPDLPDDPASKVNMCVDNVYRIRDDGSDRKLTQLIFCDLSTPSATPTRQAAKAGPGNLDSPELHALETLAEKDAAEEQESSFCVYDDIREKLVKRGVPREQIAFIHEANTEVRKKELFAKVRSGQVRVLIGSTFKMGAGMNVQDRLIALHDLDAPWRPGDLEQRSGRIIRQGNTNPTVHIYRYVTEGTFDAYLWQTLENKQKFISQIMTSKSPVRACDDLDETALSFAEVKALCAGDPRIKEKMDLDVDVARLKLMKSNHQSQQFQLEDNLLKYFPEEIEKNKGFITGFKADMETLAAHPHPEDGFASMTIRGDVLTDKENAGAALLDAFKEVKGVDPVEIGSYRGFKMSLAIEDFAKKTVLTLKGQMTHRVELGHDPRGNLVRIDNALDAMAGRLDAVEKRLQELYGQVEDAKQELGKPFPQEAELREKSARLVELNNELNIDERTPMEALADDRDAVAKAARSSVLGKLKGYTAQEGPERKTVKPTKEER